MDNCKTCGKRTKYMYTMNDGLYCDKHKEAAHLNQKINLDLEAIKQGYDLKLFLEATGHPCANAWTNGRHVMIGGICVDKVEVKI